MALTTYVPIETYTVSGTSTNTITFGAGNTLPQTYTDLVMVFQGGVTAGSADFYYQFNNITTGSFYSVTKIRGNGSGAATSADANQDNLPLEWYGYLEANMNVANISQIMNYSNNTTFKTVYARSSSSSSGVNVNIGCWRKTDPITLITVKTTASYFANGSTFTLYGIANSNIGAPKATGGIITQDSTYYYHTFGASGTFTPQQSLTVDYLIVAGGGGGGNNSGGGGGAGGFYTSVAPTGGGGTAGSSASLSAIDYSIVVGSGGAGGTNGDTRGSSGGNSTFNGITVYGGGGGGSGGVNTNGINGGSGGGATYLGSVGTGTANQGYNGGNYSTDGSTYTTGGGGGGAGALGQNASSSTAGNGGIGLYNAITNARQIGELSSGNYYLAGGGGGAGHSASGHQGAGSGGVGGGGAGAPGTGGLGTAGLVNTGGGGGSANNNGNSNGNGGSGVVIIRYLK